MFSTYILILRLPDLNAFTTRLSSSATFWSSRPLIFLFTFIGCHLYQTCKDGFDPQDRWRWSVLRFLGGIRYRNSFRVTTGLPSSPVASNLEQKPSSFKGSLDWRDFVGFSVNSTYSIFLHPMQMKSLQKSYYGLPVDFSQLLLSLSSFPSINRPLPWLVRPLPFALLLEKLFWTCLCF